MGMSRKLNKTIVKNIGFIVILGAILAIGPNIKSKIQTVVSSGDKLANKYTSTDGVGEIGRWDISGNQESKVTAVLTNDGTLTISGSGYMKSWTENPMLEWQSSEYNEQVKRVIIEEGIINIGNYAFYECVNLENIEISERITIIGYGAFYNCSNLKNIQFPKGITSIEEYAFRGCSSLTSIKFQEGLVSIGQFAFCNCNNLTNIELPMGLETISDNAFYNCTNLESIKIAEGLTSIVYGLFAGCENLTNIELPETLVDIGPKAFEGCSKLANIVIPKSVTNIGYNAFSKCSSLTSIEMQEGIENIGNSTFSECSSLISIKIPKGVKSIGENIFWECSNLKNIELSSGLEEIGKNAFYNCIRLTDIEIPSGVKELRDNTFYNCNSLMNVKIPESVTKIGYRAFYKCILLGNVEGIIGVKEIGREAFYECSSLKNIELPNGLTSIGNDAFYKCISLTSIDIPSGITVIENNLFYGCIKLKNIKLPNGITSIRNYAFYECCNLIEIELPDEITSIGDSAFYRCENLVEIKMPERLESISGNAFRRCISLKNIIIPEGVTYIGGWAFDGCSKLESINIPEGVTSIGDALFWGCKSLTSVKLPKGITNIGTLAFSSCTNLVSMELPNGLKNIDERAFQGCTSLTNINIPNGIENIGYETFGNCTSLTQIKIPEGITNIKARAFEGCSNLITIELPNVIPNIEEYVFYGCTNLIDVKLPNVANIGNYAFNGCEITKVIEQGNNSIELPDILKRTQDENDILYSDEEFTLTNCAIEDSMIKINEGETYARISITSGYLEGLTYELTYNSWDISEAGDKSIIAVLSTDGGLIIYGQGKMKNWSKDNVADWYEHAEKIKYVVIEEGIKNIGGYAFQGCNELKDIIIPKSVEIIGENIFNYEIIKMIYYGESSVELPNILRRIQNKENILYSNEGLKLTNCTIEDEYIRINNDVEFAQIEVLSGNLKGLIYTFYSNTWDISKDENSCVTAEVSEYGYLYINGHGELDVYKNALDWWNYIKPIIRDVYIRNEVSNIQDYMFENCYNLVDIDISSKILEIGKNPFIGCTNLKNIYFSDYGSDSIYEMRGSMIYTKDRKEIVVYFPMREDSEYIIPNEVTTINAGAFAGCNNLISLLIPDNVTEIGERAFEGCENLTIICKRGSVAETYAIENNINYELEEIAPKAEVSYSITNFTNRNVVVTIEADEEIKEVNGWYLSTDKMKLTKEYLENTLESGEDIIIKDLVGNETIINVKVTNIDKESPSIEIKAEATSSKIKVQVEAIDEMSGINENSYRYYISQNPENYGNMYVSNSEYTFTNLKSGTKYFIKVEVYDKLWNKGDKEIIVETLDTNKISSTTHIVDEENLIIKEITPGTTVEEIKENLQSDISYEIQDKNGNPISEDAKIGTGCKLKMQNNKIYTLIVTGDCDGDGKITVNKDIIKMNAHRLSGKGLIEEYLLAADADQDGEIKVKDIILINAIRLNQKKNLP